MKRLAGVLAMVAAPLLGELSPQKAAWFDGPEQYLMTGEETITWSRLKTDAEAGVFIASFWERRDPTPATPANEYREEFDRRVRYADANFVAPNSPRGALTDRGRIWILFGRPTRQASYEGDGPASAPRNPPVEAYSGDDAKREKWIYDGPYAQQVFNRPIAEFSFVDLHGDRFFELEPTTVDVESSRLRVSAPYARAAVVRLQTESLETAIASMKTGAMPTRDSEVSYAEFVSPAGESYIPLGLFVPTATRAKVDTFFGVVDDATGKRVGAFERPAKATEARSGSFYDATLMLRPGRYTATLGLAKDGAPVVLSARTFEVTLLDKDARGTSGLVVSEIIETTEAAPVKAPFAFGKMKIVPRSAFTSRDTVGYFVELHNPGVDAATNLPKLQAKVDLLPPSGPPLSAPLADVRPLPLSGVAGPGEYAIISGIPLAALRNVAPGEYTLRVSVIDTVTKQSYTVEQKFKVVG